MSESANDTIQAAEILRGLRLVDTDLFLRTFLPVGSADISQVASTLSRLSSWSSDASDDLNVYEHVVNNANTILGAYEGSNLDIHSHWKTFGPRNNYSGAACVLGSLQSLFRTRQLIEELEIVGPKDVHQQDKILLLCQTALDVAALLLPARIRSPNEVELSSDIQSLKSRIYLDSTDAITYLVQTGEILETLLLGHNHSIPSNALAPTSFWVKHIKVLIRILWLRRTSEEDDESEDDISWLRVNTPAKLRQKNLCIQYNEGSIELCRSMQKVLAAQRDRHFVFGLLIRRSGVRVFYCDRSGVLATESWIYLRVQHDKFIQVVLALSALHPRILGWDQHMKLYLNSCRGVHEFRYTTDPKVQLKDHAPSPSHARWAIFVPDDDASTKGTWYLTIQQTNVRWETSVIGPASMNWTVRELNSDMTDVTEGPPLALKLSWVRRTSPTEQELQGSIPIDNVGVILSSVKSGFVDSYGFSAHNTQRFRHGIQVTKVVRHWSEGKPGPVEPRVLVTTLLQTSGWPVRFFTDLTELVRTIRDALQGHHNLYFKNGVLHRNVTPDNILICPTDFKSSDLDLGFTTSGCVVDLDHAKQSSQRIKYDPRGLSNVDDEIWALNIKRNDYAGFGPKLDDIWRRCQGVRNNALTFADELKRLENIAEPVRDKVMDALCFPSEEQYRRWVDESQSVSRPPSWKDVLVDGPDRTGTFLFMSSEMIYGHSYSPGSLNDNYPQHHRSDIGKMGPIHTAIHDIESFFWVLVYECFVRDGPGGRRRPQVMPGRSMTTHLNILFNNKNAQKKFELFRNPDLFEKDVVSFFHPYFNRLKPLVREWWHILICTYRTSDDVTQGLIHDKIIGMLNKHLDIIVSGEPDEAETREKVIQRGKAELQRRMNMCKKLIVSTLLYDQDGSVGDNEDDEDDEDEDDEDEDENTEDED